MTVLLGFRTLAIEKEIEEEEERDEEETQVINEVKLAPWRTTSDFHAFLEDKCLLAITGADLALCDPPAPLLPGSVCCRASACSACISNPLVMCSATILYPKPQHTSLSCLVCLFAVSTYCKPLLELHMGSVEFALIALCLS